jgi:lysophospholipase L1-like esterase
VVRRRIARTSAAGLVLAALACVLAVLSPSAADPAERVRLLIVGDSMTQGSAGDWTWRYRLWKELERSGADVDLVGPSTDLFDVTTNDFGSHDYVDPDFDQDHAARWGLTLAFPDEHRSIADLVTDYHPDVVVELLGVNDLTWLQGSPEELIDGLRDWVAAGRAVDPDLDFVLGRIPQPWLEKVSVFNEELEELADELGTESSRVVVAESDADLARDEDSWDGAHPNARGEIKIAAGVADALADLGIGAAVPRPLPIEQTVLGPRLPALIGPVTASPHSIHLSWTRSPGAPQTEVWARDATAAEPWHRVGDRTESTEATLDGLSAWHRFEVKVLPVKGQAAADDMFSAAATIEVPGDHLDRPEPSGSAGSDGTATVSWPPVPGATSYAVQWRRADLAGAWSGTTTAAGSVVVGGLVGRAAYAFRVQAVRGDLVSDFSAEAQLSVPPVAAAAVLVLRRTGHGFRTRAARVPAATSYTLRVATAARCRRVPGDARFTIRAAGLVRPAKRLRSDARAVWVRWVAVRDGVEGSLAPESTRCVRLPRR